MFHNIDNASREFEHQRLGALDEFVHAKQPVLAAPCEALLMRTLPPEALERLPSPWRWMRIIRWMPWKTL